LIVTPIHRAVALEMEGTRQSLLAVIDAGQQDITRILRDFADANDQVAEALGRSLVRLSSQLEHLQDELDGMRIGTGDPAQRV
jgi:hypothetical protein